MRELRTESKQVEQKTYVEARGCDGCLVEAPLIETGGYSHTTGTRADRAADPKGWGLVVPADGAETRVSFAADLCPACLAKVKAFVGTLKFKAIEAAVSP